MIGVVVVVVVDFHVVVVVVDFHIGGPVVYFLDSIFFCAVKLPCHACISHAADFLCYYHLVIVYNGHEIFLYYL